MTRCGARGSPPSTNPAQNTLVRDSFRSTHRGTRAAAFYRERLGFFSKADDDRLGIMIRDDIEIHFWEANDPTTWGAEPHLPGSAPCRMRVDEVHALYDEYATGGVNYPNGWICDQAWGETDFTVLDLDGNAFGVLEPTSQS